MEGKNRYFSSVFNGIGSNVNGRENGYSSSVSHGPGSDVNGREKQILFIHFQWNRERCEWKGKTDTFHPFSME